MIYPWQQTQLQQLLSARQANRLPHALLFTGMSGVGKSDFAHAFTGMLLCQQLATNGESCGVCHACRLLAGRAHPNVLWVEPEKTGAAIKIDQIREVGEFISQSSMQGEYRIVVINPANDMNVNAANALLKTLEEPASGAVLVLISDQNASLPATILSRCQRVTFPRPPQALALPWLQAQALDSDIDRELLLSLAQGAPLAAVQLVTSDALVIRQTIFQTLIALAQAKQDPLSAAASFKDAEPLQVLDFMLSWFVDLMRLQSGIAEIINLDYAQPLQALIAKTDRKNTSDFITHLQRLRAQLCAGFNFNKQLMFEDLLIRYRECA